jgi:hypothetical protein
VTHLRPFAAAVFAALLFALGLAACGHDEEPAAKPPAETPNPATPPAVKPPEPGVYELDADRTYALVKHLRPDVSLDDIRATKVRFELQADGSFVARTEDPTTTYSASGTWKTQGDHVTITTTEMNGKRLDEPTDKIAVYQDGVLVFGTDEKTQPLVLKRR